MKLHEIVKQRFEKQNQLRKITHEFREQEKAISLEIENLIRLENIGSINIDVEKVQIAESVLLINGDPYGRIDGNHITIAELAIIDIARDCEFMKTQYYGNKTYSGYYQRCNCRYGYGPNHGGTKDKIGLKDAYRKEELTDEQKDACIYYIKNYKEISQLLTTNN